MSRKQRKLKHENSEDKLNRKQRREQEFGTKTFGGTNEDYDLGNWYPTTKQEEMIATINNKPLTLVQGSSGSGKTTTALYYALKSLKMGWFDRVIFIKTPSESGDDKIGFLTGDTNAKLEAHFQVMRSIFTRQFMSANKLQMDEKNKKIVFTIPNFVLGDTFDNAIVIIDEGQTLSNSTMKLLTERAGKNTKYIILGDKSQRYSASNRNDGFTNLINKVKSAGIYAENYVGLIEFTSEDNVRSELSKFITRLYES